MTTGNDIIKPRTRLAKFLAKIAGVYDEPIEPKTEIEKYLKEIAENGSGGGGGGVFIANMVVEAFSGNAYLDKTYQEIQDAMAAGQVPYMRLQGNRVLSSLAEVYSDWLVAIILGEDTEYSTKTGDVQKRTYIAFVIVPSPGSTELGVVRFESNSKDGVLTMVGE